MYNVRRQRGINFHRLRFLSAFRTVFPFLPKGGERLFPIFTNRVQDHAGHTVGIFEDIAVGKPDYSETFAFHEFRSRGVIRRLYGMTFSVKFYDEPLAAGGKIGDIVWAENHLPHEFDAFQAATAQDRPKFRFWRGQFASQSFGVVSDADIPLQLILPPSPWRRFASPFPLPLKGVRGIGNVIHHAQAN